MSKNYSSYFQLFFTLFVERQFVHKWVELEGHIFLSLDSRKTLLYELLLRSLFGVSCFCTKATQMFYFSLAKFNSVLLFLYSLLVSLSETSTFFSFVHFRFTNVFEPISQLIYMPSQTVLYDRSSRVLE